MTTIKYSVPNISCGHCVHTIQSEVSEVEGVQLVKADQGSRVVEITFEAPATEEKIKQLLAEKPNAIGLAVAGMPVGSPGMEGGRPEPYDVILFGRSERRIYMRFIGERQL